jgi:hypothetical protein
MIYLLLSLAMATNAANEGTFTNVSMRTLTCLKDVDGKRHEQVIGPAQSCQGDAIQLSETMVFKIPNSTFFSCDQTCEADDLVSWLIMHYALNKRHGSMKYGEMDLMWFEGIMGWR